MLSSCFAPQSQCLCQPIPGEEQEHLHSLGTLSFSSAYKMAKIYENKSTVFKCSEAKRTNPLEHPPLSIRRTCQCS